MAITKTRSSFPSSAGQGIDVSYMVWKDDAKKPVGVIQVTHGYGPKLATKKLEAKKRNVTMKIYEHAKHEIHNEGAIKDEVFADLLDFFNRNNPKCK